MADNIVKIKSYKLAIEIVNLYKYLIAEKKEYTLSKQMLRSGTSIAANIREGVNAQSKADFVHKFSVSQKEADETMFWLELLKDTEYITEETFDKIYDQCKQVMKIISRIIITSKQKNRKS